MAGGKHPKSSKTGVPPKSPGQTAPTPKNENGDDETGAAEDLDAILPVTEGEAPPRPEFDDNGDDDDVPLNLDPLAFESFRGKKKR